MTDSQIERAAKLMKIVHLANSGLDAVAIKLNCSPTYEERRQASRWATAFKLAQREGDILALASELSQS